MHTVKTSWLFQLQSVYHGCRQTGDSGYERFALVFETKETQGQWRSQGAVNARAQHGHNSYPGPAQLSVACSMEMQKQVGGSGGCSPRKFWNF